MTMQPRDRSRHKMRELFKSGLDTLRIANLYLMEESTVSHLIYVARCESRGLKVDCVPPPPSIDQIREKFRKKKETML